jgi:hypothetical protein
MILFPYLKKQETKPGLTEVEERPKDHLGEATIKCEKSFSKLEEYLHIGFTPYYLDNIVLDVLNADKSFTKLKYHITKLNYSLEKFDYGNYIEHNLKKLKRKVSIYEVLESTSGKVVTYGGISSIIGLLFGILTYSQSGGNVGGSVATGIGSAIIALIPFATESFRRNYITSFIQKSHQPPIKNIITYSDLFFTDLREKTKNI